MKDHMELVKFNKDGGIVTVQVSVNGLAAWKYKYVTNGHHIDKSSLDQRPSIHALGLPHELESSIHTWEIQLGNTSGTVQGYRVAVTWEQDGHELHTWSKTGTLATILPDKVESDSALLDGA